MARTKAPLTIYVCDDWDRFNWICDRARLAYSGGRIRGYIIWDYHDGIREVSAVQFRYAEARVNVAGIEHVPFVDRVLFYHPTC